MNFKKIAVLLFFVSLFCFTQNINKVNASDNVISATNQNGYIAEIIQETLNRDVTSNSSNYTESLSRLYIKITKDGKVIKEKVPVNISSIQLNRIERFPDITTNGINFFFAWKNSKDKTLLSESSIYYSIMDENGDYLVEAKVFPESLSNGQCTPATIPEINLNFIDDNYLATWAGNKCLRIEVLDEKYNNVDGLTFGNGKELRYDISSQYNNNIYHLVDNNIIKKDDLIKVRWYISHFVDEYSDNYFAFEYYDEFFSLTNNDLVVNSIVKFNLYTLKENELSDGCYLDDINILSADSAPPISCIDTYEPVCGIDGKTYSNECYAGANNVNVDHDGECVSLEKCKADQCELDGECVKNGYKNNHNKECYNGNWVNIAESTTTRECIESDWNYTLEPKECIFNSSQIKYWKKITDCVGGVTHKSSEIIMCGDDSKKTELKCSDVYIPVCGVNKETYSNKCYASLNNVKVDYVGECVVCAKSECNLNGECVADQYINGDSYCAKGKWLDLHTQCGEGECSFKGECVKDGYIKNETSYQNSEKCKNSEWVSNACLESDWTYIMEPTVCPSSNVQTKYWKKINNCEGGVSHKKIEEINCHYNKICASENSIIDEETPCCNGLKKYKINGYDNMICMRYNYSDIKQDANYLNEEEKCTDLYDPVCGINGKIYPNKCVANNNHIKIKYSGECIETKSENEKIDKLSKQLNENKIDDILSGINETKNKTKEQEYEVKYLTDFSSDFKTVTYNIKQAIRNFITYGVDKNTQKLGAGERVAVLNSYKEVFNKIPENETDLSDILKISNGNWPSRRNIEKEREMKDKFIEIYKRIPDMNNQNDNAAITIMTYGLKQKAKNRNLESEKNGIKTFKNIFNKNPKTTQDWNVMQAITYSGAKRMIDSDKDLIPDELEEKYGTNIFNPDSDWDGYSDGLEVLNRYNPMHQVKEDR